MGQSVSALPPAQKVSKLLEMGRRDLQHCVYWTLWCQSVWESEPTIKNSNIVPLSHAVISAESIYTALEVSAPHLQELREIERVAAETEMGQSAIFPSGKENSLVRLLVKSNHENDYLALTNTEL